jgi:succinate dehydrogenase hydrophobic anchor subunit
MATGLAMVICYLTVFLFIRAVTAPDRNYEDVRGVFAAVAITFSIALAHEWCAVRP